MGELGFLFFIALHVYMCLCTCVHRPAQSSTEGSCIETSSERSIPTSKEKTSTHRVRASKSSKRKRSQLDDIETTIFSKLNENDDCDAEEHFGLHIASTLHTLTPRQRAFVKMEIDRLLYSVHFPNVTTGIDGYGVPYALPTTPSPASSIQFTPPSP